MLQSSKYPSNKLYKVIANVSFLEQAQASLATINKKTINSTTPTTQPLPTTITSSTLPAAANNQFTEEDIKKAAVTAAVRFLKTQTNALDTKYQAEIKTLEEKISSLESAKQSTQETLAVFQNSSTMSIPVPVSDQAEPESPSPSVVPATQSNSTALFQQAVSQHSQIQGLTAQIQSLESAHSLEALSTAIANSLSTIEVLQQTQSGEQSEVSQSLTALQSNLQKQQAAVQTLLSQKTRLEREKAQLLLKKAELKASTEQKEQLENELKSLGPQSRELQAKEQASLDTKTEIETLQIVKTAHANNKTDKIPRAMQKKEKSKAKKVNELQAPENQDADKTRKLEETIRQLEIQIQTANYALAKQPAELEQEILAKQKIKEQLDNDVATLKQQVSQLQTLKQKLQSKTSQVHALQSQIESLHTKTSQNESHITTQQQSVCQSVQSEVEKVEKDPLLATLSAENNDLKQEITKLKQTSTSISDPSAQEQIKKLTQELQQKNLEVQTMQESLRQQIQNETRADMQKDFNKAIDLFTKKITALETELNSTRKELAALRANQPHIQPSPTAPKAPTDPSALENELFGLIQAEYYK